MSKKLLPAGAQRLIEHLGNEIGPRYHLQLKSLLELIQPDGDINLAEALKRLYPDTDIEKAQTNFRQLRQELRNATTKAEPPIDLDLQVDSKKRSGPDQRAAWFWGEDPAAEQFSLISAKETDKGPLDAKIESQGAVEKTPDGKTVVRCFICYAHANKQDKERLMDLLLVRLNNLKVFSFTAWSDREIDPGDLWDEAIHSALEECHMGILLLSHELLQSRYSMEVELDKLLKFQKRLIPVCLGTINFSGFDLKGLEQFQIFRDDDKKCFVERSRHKQGTFCELLAERMGRVAARLFSAPPPPSPPCPPARHWMESRQQQVIEARLGQCGSIIDPSGHEASLDKLEALPDEPARLNAIDYLTGWACNDPDHPIAALLGDTGMGKTTSCQLFTKRLLHLREGDKTRPLPIYLDLRHLGKRVQERPDLDAVITTILRNGGMDRESAMEAPKTLRGLMREQPTIVIWDGLDEVLVHLDAAEGQRFTDQLLGLIPPQTLPRKGNPGAKQPFPGKLLISCRTHYFRTLRHQKTHLTGADRIAVNQDHYRCFVLLPFNERQILSYLEQNIPGRDPKELLALIRSVHNLPELAERPYTLSLIARHIPQLEQWKLAGNRVTGATLYRHMVDSWLERDLPKQSLKLEHKWLLMEHLSAELWRRGQRSWQIDELEELLADFIEQDPRIARRYRDTPIELLEEDMRTATFLRREGEAQFRFAHSSLQEFFLAAYLLRALTLNQPERWQMAMPSRETLDFLGQLLAEQEDPQPQLDALQQLHQNYKPQAGENALAFNLLARERGYPCPPLIRADLRGARLRDWQFRGSEEEPLDLSGCDFSGAELEDSRFHHCRLVNANFSEARLARAELLHCDAVEAKFHQSLLAGTIFRHCRLSQADFSGALLHRSQWIDSDLDAVQGLALDSPGALLACNRPKRFADRPSIPVRLHSLLGHQAMVNSAAFHLTLPRAISASDDHTVKIWDTESGQCLLTLQSHHDGVSAAAFHPSLSRAISASRDKTLKIWDTESGLCLLTLRGHLDSVTSAAFHPTLPRAISASGDNGVKIWDTTSGQCLLTLQGHQGVVTSAAFHPTLPRAISASWDNTIKIWDTTSGQCLLTLQSHHDGVSTAAFHPAIPRAISASWDSTVRIWDTASGQRLLTLRGHQNGVKSAAFHSALPRAISAGRDNTVKIWDTESGQCLLTLQGHQSSVNSVAFHPTLPKAISASSEGAVKIWDTELGQCLMTLQDHQGSVKSVALHSTLPRAISASRDKTLNLWDTESGQRLLTFEGHQEGVSFGALHPILPRAISSSWDGTIKIWDTESGQCLLTLQGHQHWVYSAVFHPALPMVISASADKSLKIWDTESGQCLVTLQGHQSLVRYAVFHPTLPRAISASEDSSIKIWDTESGRCLLTLHGHQHWATSATFHPALPRAISASSDRSIKVWDTESGQCTLTLEGHQGGVTSVAFHPTLPRAISASWDNRVKVWDTDSGQCLRTLELGSPVLACGLDGEGRHIISALLDGRVMIHGFETGEPIDFYFHHLPNGEYATLRSDHCGAVFATPGAWRYLGWTVPPGVRDPELTIYPAETFGPLPAYG